MERPGEPMAVQLEADPRQLRRRRAFRARFPIAYGLSYLLDGAILALFAGVGTIAVWIPIAYTAAGTASSAFFSWLMASGRSERFADKYLTLHQVCVSATIMVVFLALAPMVGFHFLGTLFIVSGFGSLRLPWRKAAIAAVAMAVAAGVVLTLFVGNDASLLPYSSPPERVLVWVWFTLALARLTALGVIGSLFRESSYEGHKSLRLALADAENSARELSAAKAAAETASRAKTQFLTNMSHEIRTPMNAVLGLSELLLDSGLSEAQRERADGIRNSVQALLQVINRVLDVSRIEAGRMELVCAPFDLREMFAQVRAMLLPLARAKGLQLEVSLGGDVPSVLSGDEARLRQIVVNLAGNAIKFTERGRVGIDVEMVDPEDEDGAELRIRVVDTGPGFAPETMDTLFERFVQGDGSDTRRHGGSGLGLYIARELAQLMAGDVSAQSMPGVGSTFEARVRLGLPGPGEALAAVRSAARSPEAPAEAGGRSYSVLLAEDNDVNQLVARAMLEAAGHRVTVASDGAQAAAHCAVEKFDCVLMDCQMPVMDGVEATRRIREQEERSGGGRRTPIVALTANAMHGDRERYLAAGMDGFLAKPFAGRELLDTVARAAKLGVRPAAGSETEKLKA